MNLGWWILRLSHNKTSMVWWGGVQPTSWCLKAELETFLASNGQRKPTDTWLGFVGLVSYEIYPSGERSDIPPYTALGKEKRIFFSSALGRDMLVPRISVQFGGCWTPFCTLLCRRCAANSCMQAYCIYLHNADISRRVAVFHLMRTHW